MNAHHALLADKEFSILQKPPIIALLPGVKMAPGKLYEQTYIGLSFMAFIGAKCTSRQATQ
jgi:hypothetical protein